MVQGSKRKSKSVYGSDVICDPKSIKIKKKEIHVFLLKFHSWLIGYTCMDDKILFYKFGFMLKYTFSTFCHFYLFDALLDI